MIKALSVALPPKPLYDPSFQYRHSWNTDRNSIAETMRKAREEQQQAMVIHRRIDNAKAD